MEKNIMGTSAGSAKAWIHVGILFFTVVKVALTAFGIYIPNIPLPIGDIPTDQILNFVAAAGGAVSTKKLAEAEPIKI